jgi:hypothetical protein
MRDVAAAELTRVYLQAFCLAVQVGMTMSPVHFIETGPTALAPIPLIELLRAAVAMNFARSGVIMVACPPARTHFAFASACELIMPPATTTVAKAAHVIR